MSADMPWNIEGVDPEAREAAKLAARRQGISIGQWLTQTILSNAAQELKHRKRNRDAGAPDDEAVATEHDYDSPDLIQRSQKLYGAQFASEKDATNGRSGPPALTPEAILESIQKLAARVEESENRTAEAIEPLAQRIANLDSQVGEIRDRGPVTTAPVERAMMRLAERLEKLEGERQAEMRRGFVERLFGRG